MGLSPTHPRLGKSGRGNLISGDGVESLSNDGAPSNNQLRVRVTVNFTHRSLLASFADIMSCFVSHAILGGI